MKTVNQIETVVEEEENIKKEEDETVHKEEATKKEDTVTKDEIIQETLEESPVVTVEAVQGNDIKLTKENTEDSKDIKEAGMEGDLKDSTNENASSDILTNKRPAEEDKGQQMEDKDDPPPPYQLLSGKKQIIKSMISVRKSWYLVHKGSK